jgi:pantothenate kinase
MDGFHLAQSELVRLGRRERMGAPDTFDSAGYAALLKRLRGDEAVVYAPEFRREIEEPIAGAELRVERLIQPSHRVRQDARVRARVGHAQR